MGTLSWKNIPWEQTSKKNGNSINQNTMPFILCNSFGTQPESTYLDTIQPPFPKENTFLTKLLWNVCFWHLSEENLQLVLGSELRSSHFRVLNPTTFSATTQEILLNLFPAAEKRASLKVLTNKLEGNQLLHCSSSGPPHRLLITCCWASWTASECSGVGRDPRRARSEEV